MQHPLKNVDGQMISLDSYPEAKGFIIVFTCNHCPYAIPYEGRLNALHDRFASQGYPLIAICANDPVKYPQDSYENMIVRAKAKDFRFPYLVDESQEVAHTYGAERTPHAFVYQRQGADLRLVYKGAIDDNYRQPAQVQSHYVAEQVERLIAGENPEYTETPAVGCSIKWK